MTRADAVRARKVWNEKRRLAQTAVPAPSPQHWSANAIASPMPSCECSHRRIAHFTPHRKRFWVGRPWLYSLIPCSVCDCENYEAAS